MSACGADQKNTAQTSSSTKTTNIESDGPNVALTRMRNEEVSMLMAVDRKRHLKGIITADQALEA
ncbi:hypothetical protein EFM1CSP_17455, partial [Enterococcus faecium]